MKFALIFFFCALASIYGLEVEDDSLIIEEDPELFGGKESDID